MLLAFFEFATHWSAPAVWFWVLLLIAVVWSRRHLDLHRGKKEPLLSAVSPDGPQPLPRLTILVAGKDEEANIGRCISDLLRQDYPDFEVIAANDRSIDRTGAIMDEWAARDPRVKAVHVRDLPAGWGGKNHAMHQAMQHATGEYLCFTDADCKYHAPHLLRAAVRYAEQTGTQFLSVLPELEAHTFWERVVQPPAGAIMVFWFPPQKVNSPAHRHAYANGAFMLMPRATYDAIGGHIGSKGQLNEDMHFAKLAKQNGRRLFVIRGDGMYSVRMYTGLRQIWNGWTRIFYCCFGTLPRLFVSVIFLSVFSLLPYLSLLAAFVWMLASPSAASPAPGIALAASAAIIAQQSVLWQFYALSRTPPWWALTYPLGAGMCLAVTFNAMRRYTGARTVWRGTAYTGGI